MGELINNIMERGIHLGANKGSRVSTTRIWDISTGNSPGTMLGFRVDNVQSAVAGLLVAATENVEFVCRKK